MRAAAKAAADFVDAFSRHSVKGVEHGDAGCNGDDGGLDERPETNLDNVPTEIVGAFQHPRIRDLDGSYYRCTRDQVSE